MLQPSSAQKIANSSRERRKSHLFLGIKAFISIFLIYYILSNVEGKEVVASIGAISTATVLISSGFLVVQTLVLALRWYMVAAAIGALLGYREVISFTFMGVFFNQVLPTSFGGDAVRIWRAYRDGVSLTGAINSVVLERISGTIVLFLLGSLSVLFLQDHITDPALRAGFVAALPIALIALAVLMFADRIPFLPTSIRRVVQNAQFAADSRRVFFDKSTMSILFVASLVSHFLAAIAAYVIASGLELTLPVWEFIPYMFLVSIVVLLPVSVAGWGVRESAMVIILGFAGVVPEKAFAISVLLGIIMLIAGFPGGVLWLLWRPKPPADCQ
ncbi:MAG: flippase-like domain-containing protein [Nitrososphaera sp.]|nr:flippase-like domain-containing protein [Nitrososphaera sp.]